MNSVRSESLQKCVLNYSVCIIPHLNLLNVVVFNFQAFDLKFLSLFGEFSTLWVLVRNRASHYTSWKYQIHCLLSYHSLPYSWKTVKWPRVGQLHPCPRFWVRNKWCEESRTPVPVSASCILFLPGQQGKWGYIISLGMIIWFQ